MQTNSSTFLIILIPKSLILSKLSSWALLGIWNPVSSYFLGRPVSPVKALALKPVCTDSRLKNLFWNSKAANGLGNFFLSLYFCYKSHFFSERQMFLIVQSRVATINRGMWRAVLYFQASFTVRVRLGTTVEWHVEAAHGSVRLGPSVHPLGLRWGLQLSAWLAIQTHSLSTDVRFN